MAGQKAGFISGPVRRGKDIQIGKEACELADWQEACCTLIRSVVS